MDKTQQMVDIDDYEPLVGSETVARVRVKANRLQDFLLSRDLLSGSFLARRKHPLPI